MKGAVIASDATPDKNKLSTGTLTYSDIQNKADYNAESSGYSVGTQKGSSGYSPGIPVSGNAGSTTQSAIAPGTIVVGGKAVTPESLRRDTTTALNELGKIFDKKTVQEKQELVNLFSKEANQAIGDFAESMVKNAKTPEEKAKWKEGGEYKAILHAFASGFTSSLSGNDFLSGAIGDGISQLAQKQLANIKDPTLRLFASAAIGAGAAKLVGGNAKIGAISAYNGTKYNDEAHSVPPGTIVKGKGGFYTKQGDDVDDEYINGGIAPGTRYWDDEQGVFCRLEVDGTGTVIGKSGDIITGVDGNEYEIQPDGSDKFKSSVSFSDVVFNNPLTQNPLSVTAGTIVVAGAILQNSTNPFGLSQGTSKAAQSWGVLEDGSNQGIKHYFQYMDEFPDRIPGLARRLGIDANQFTKSAEGFEKFTEQAVRVINEGTPKDVGGGKVYYYLETNAKEGVLVVTKDGKLQSMMSSNPKYFNKLEN